MLRVGSISTLSRRLCLSAVLGYGGLVEVLVVCCGSRNAGVMSQVQEDTKKKVNYGKFLTTNSRYKSAFAHSNDPYKFANILQSSGYATDPQYAKKLQSIVSTDYLDDYDK